MSSSFRHGWIELFSLTLSCLCVDIIGRYIVHMVGKMAPNSLKFIFLWILIPKKENFFLTKCSYKSQEQLFLILLES